MAGGEAAGGKISIQFSKTVEDEYVRDASEFPPPLLEERDPHGAARGRRHTLNQSDVQLRLLQEAGVLLGLVDNCCPFTGPNGFSPAQKLMRPHASTSQHHRNANLDQRIVPLSAEWNYPLDP